MQSATQQWKNYMRELAIKNSLIGLKDRPFAFVTTAEEFGKNSDLFDGDFILWADTENIFTRSSPVDTLLSGKAALATAFTILKKTDGDNNFATKEAVIDSCEWLAWQFLQQMQHDSEPGNQSPPAIAMLDIDTVTIDRDGPYYNEHYGVTTQLIIHFHNAIPHREEILWTNNTTP